MKIIKRTLIILVAAAMLLAAVSLLSSCAYENNEQNEESENQEVNADGSVFNLLVGGTDRTSGLTDVLMLISFNRDKQQLSVMQIPRDTYADYTNKSYKKINGAYGTLGGGKALSAFLSGALGVPIHSYAIISPDAFCKAVDAVGGVEIVLDEPLYYNDPYQGLTISLPKGKQTLNGKEAEQLVRYRSGYANGDLGRIDAQKVFLASFYKKISEDITPLQLTSLAAALVGGTDTDLGVAELISLYGELSALKSENIYFVTSPGQAVVADKSGASYYVLSSKACSELLEGYFGGGKGGFDKKHLFLNTSYKSFSEIYEGYTPYKLYTLSQIGKEGIGNTSVNSIDKKTFLDYNIERKN